MTSKQLCSLSEGKDVCVEKKCEFWVAGVCEIANETVVTEVCQFDKTMNKEIQPDAWALKGYMR